jgi:hypothetical protein
MLSPYVVHANLRLEVKKVVSAVLAKELRIITRLLSFVTFGV